MQVAVVSAAQGFAQRFSQVSLLFAGDLMQHQSQLNAARVGDGAHSYSSCYDYVRDEISAADIAIANLETTIGSSRYAGYPSFCAPDSFLHAAVGAGFDVMLFANNHCLDRGKSGALYTMDMMDSLAIPHCGVYRDSIDRATRYPLMLEKNGIRIALLNYTYGTNGIPVPQPLVVNLIDQKVMERDIMRAKEMEPDVIVACMHWGDEYVSLPPKRVREMADWLLANGVNHVIGSHPHVLQPMEIRNDEFGGASHAVVYSLGNFVSGMYARGRDGGMLVNMELYKYGDICNMQSLSYMLTWVARPLRDGVDNFTILPAGGTYGMLTPVARQKMEEFVRDSRRLMQKYNKGHVYEYMTR